MVTFCSRSHCYPSILFAWPFTRFLNSEEMADRLAIRELVDAYAYCADRRDAKGQMALFTPAVFRKTGTAA
jgi:hypothetical protein